LNNIEKRVFLRFPAKIKAQLVIEGKLHDIIFINEISTKGLSLYVNENMELPNLFKVDLYFPGSREPIRVKVLVMNRHKSSGMMRVGCQFADLSYESNNIISGYIIKHTGFNRVSEIFSLGAFLLFCDALFRIYGYFIYLYFKRSVTAGVVTVALPRLYGLILILYAIFCMIAFIYSEDTRRKNFNISLFFILAALVFYAGKNIEYFKAGLWGVDYSVLRPFLAVELLILIYVFLAIGISLIFSGKISNVLHLVRSHHEGMHKRKTDSPDQPLSR
jgi:hypothetical protein